MVGAGGTGSIFISHLCRILQAWTKLGGAPFAISLWDPDVVTEANLARQCFCEADIGTSKAQVLAHRLHAFYGINVKAEERRFDRFNVDTGHDLVVGCVDNLKARRCMAKVKGYWLDMGNDATSGQVILGGHGLPNFFDVFPKMKKAKDPKNSPSCSLAEALEKQDLFINSTVATLAGQLLWTLMRKGQLTHHGYFINLGTGKVSPLPVT